MSITTTPITSKPSTVDMYGTMGTSRTATMEEPVSIMAKNDKNNTVDVSQVSADDDQMDGKISFKEGATSFLKGIGNTALDMVTKPFTELAKGNPVPAIIAGVGIAAVSIIGAPAVVALGAVGVVTGGAQFIGGIAKAFDPNNTDADTKAALEQAGGGAFTAGVSALAVKGGINSMKSVEGSAMSQAKGFRETTKAYFKDTGEVLHNKFGSLTSKLPKVGGKGTAAAEGAEGAAEGTAAKPTTTEATPEVKAQADQILKEQGQQAKVDQMLADAKAQQAGTQKPATQEPTAPKQETKLYNDNTKASPQAETYKQADSIQLTDEQVAARGQEQVAKFNGRRDIQTEIDTLDKRIANLESKGGSKGSIQALKQQRAIKVNELQAQQAAPQAPAAQPAPQGPTSLTGKNLTTYNKMVNEMSPAEISDWIDMEGVRHDQGLINALSEFVKSNSTKTVTPTTVTAPKPAVDTSTLKTIADVEKAFGIKMTQTEKFMFRQNGTLPARVAA